jgi:hypothetical protein
MKKWKEVNLHSGQEIEEDAPATSVSNSPTGMFAPTAKKMKKKDAL